MGAEVEGPDTLQMDTELGKEALAVMDWRRGREASCVEARYRRGSKLGLTQHFYKTSVCGATTQSSDLRHMQRTRSVDSVQFLPFLTTDVK